MTIKRFTVQRDKWWRGQGAEYSCLLSTTGPSKGKMCCLGFLGEACGVNISDFTLPSETDPDSWPDGLVHLKKTGANEYPDETALSNAIIRTNDDPDISDVDRELELTILFNKVGIDVEFT